MRQRFSTLVMLGALLAGCGRLITPQPEVTSVVVAKSYTVGDLAPTADVHTCPGHAGTYAHTYVDTHPNHLSGAIG
jgi:hypothetical protein